MHSACVNASCILLGQGHDLVRGFTMLLLLQIGRMVCVAVVPCQLAVRSGKRFHAMGVLYNLPACVSRRHTEDLPVT